MNEVEIIFHNEKEIDNNFLGFANLVLEELKIDNWSFSITFTDNSYIKELNRDYRSKDEATDVITFAMLDEEDSPIPGDIVYPGDIVISMDAVRTNSDYFKEDFERELKRVIIHGILHLKGLDHQTNDKDEPMLIYQEEIVNKMDKVGVF